jgi:GST-like protein
MIAPNMHGQDPAMTIELYAFDTPNGRKISVALEEMALPYTVKVIDISKGEQHDPEFLKISPNNRIPAILDPDGPDGAPISVFESGAILIYLGEKTGRFWPTDLRARRRARMADVPDGRLWPDAGTGAPLPHAGE